MADASAQVQLLDSRADPPSKRNPTGFRPIVLSELLLSWSNKRLRGETALLCVNRAVGLVRQHLPLEVLESVLLAATLSSTYSVNPSGSSVSVLTIVRALVGMSGPAFAGKFANWGTWLHAISAAISMSK